jgi:SAM-dependent methyltransferase
MNKHLEELHLRDVKIADVGSAFKPVDKFVTMENCEYDSFDIVRANNIIDLTVPFTYKKGDNYFDVAFCLEVFEHLPQNLEVAVTNLKNLLKNKGVLYFAVPGMFYPEHGIDYQRFTERKIVSLLEKDFEIVDMKKYYAGSDAVRLLKQAFEIEQIELDAERFILNYFLTCIKK